jgi:hypothetical protein
VLSLASFVGSILVSMFAHRADDELGDGAESFPTMPEFTIVWPKPRPEMEGASIAENGSVSNAGLPVGSRARDAPTSIRRGRSRGRCRNGTRHTRPTTPRGKVGHDVH